ncbi:MAG TPA: sulfatase-like hydrolase/transferase, partial [Gemmataceae bacterium]|nr:sulfatase-like hydrolase/transferase [Gemmataceae bacterium]
MKRTTAQVLIFMAAGALLGYAAASERSRLTDSADAASPDRRGASKSAAQSTPETLACCSDARGVLLAQDETKSGQPGEVIVITVRLPADAVLEIDGFKTESTGQVRTFETPPLSAGKTYSYTLKATSQGKEVSRKIEIAYGADNTFDLRPEFRTAAAKPGAKRTAAYAQPANGTPIQTAGTPGSPGATTTISGKQLPPPDPKFGGVIKDNAAQSKAWWAPRVVPPKQTPNVLLIMTDDVGFGAPSTFGGVIPTPALDRVAKAGLRYTCMHSTALCSPTRAANITGRNHLSAGFGVVSEQSTGFPGYNSIIEKDKATIGRILKDNGFATSWFGKDHNTPTFQASQAGPFDQWPIGMGFEYFYGFVGGDTSQWQPNLFRNTTAIYPYVGKPGWNLITAMADDAIEWLNEINQIDPSKPFFCYYVPGGTHAPHHPTKEWVEKIHAMHLFDDGWNKLRDTIFANQKKLGVIPQDAKMTPWPKDLLKDWDSLNANEKKMFIRQVEVYAAYLAYTDHEIGRVIQTVEDMGKLDNTIIIYISGDNGSSAEGTLIGTPNEVASLQGVSVPVEDQLKFFYDVWGTDQTYNHMAVAWTWAFDTPFSWTKQIASHFGGTRQGMCVSWPGHIKVVGGIRNQFHHVIDVVPTLLEVCGISAPAYVDGIQQAPIEGTSFAYTFDPANAKGPCWHVTQYFEMMGDHAIYHE